MSPPDLRDVERQLFQLQKSAIGDVLSLAQLGLNKEQFCVFKKKVFELLHEKLRPGTKSILCGFDHGPGRANCDNHDGKVGAL